MKQEEDLYKKLLDDIPVPEFSGEYWEPLQQRLEKRRRKKRALYVFLPACIGLTIAAAYFYTNDSKQLQLHTSGYKQHSNVPAFKQEVPGSNPVQQVAAAQTKLSSHKAFHTTHPAEINRSQEIRTVNEPLASFQWQPVFKTQHTPVTVFVPVPVTATAPVYTEPLATPSVKTNTGWAIEFSTALYQADKTIKALSSDNDYYLNRRRKEEKAAVYLAPKLGISWQNKYGLLLSTGLEYMSYGERVSYKPYSLQPLEVQRYTYVPDSIPVLNVYNGSLIWKRDTSVYIENDTVMNETRDEHMAYGEKTRMSYIEIPLSIGYEWKFKGGSVMARTGIGMGLLHRQSIKGQYINPEASGLEAINKANGATDMIWNYSLNLRFSQIVCRNISVYIEPGIKRSISSSYNNGNLSQRYNTGGLSLGIKIPLR